MIAAPRAPWASPAVPAAAVPDRAALPVAASRSALLRAAATVVAAVVALSLITSMADRRGGGEDPDGVAADVVRQAVKWADTAAQDKDVLTRWQHLSLAKAYLNVGRHVASDATLERVSRTHVRALARRVDSELQETMSALYRTCSKLRPSIQLPRATMLPGERDDGLGAAHARRVTWM